jgi:hypothetical protein
MLNYVNILYIIVLPKSLFWPWQEPVNGGAID